MIPNRGVPAGRVCHVMKYWKQWQNSPSRNCGIRAIIYSSEQAEEQTHQVLRWHCIKMSKGEYRAIWGETRL